MDAELRESLDRIERLTLLSAKNVLTVDDVALLLGRSPKTIRNQMGTIPHYKNGKSVYFRREELEQWQCRVKCNPINELINQPSL